MIVRFMKAILFSLDQHALNLHEMKLCVKFDQNNPDDGDGKLPWNFWNFPEDKPVFRKQFITVASVTVSHTSFMKRIESNK